MIELMEYGEVNGIWRRVTTLTIDFALLSGGIVLH